MVIFSATISPAARKLAHQWFMMYYRTMNKRVFIVYLTVVHFFALVGIAFTAVFLAMQLGLLNVAGSIKERNAFFENAVRERNDPVVTSVATIDTQLQPSSTPLLKPTTHVATTTASSSCPTIEPCAWNVTSQWSTVSAGLAKDSQVIERVASETGVSARLIAAVAVPEQLRFFTSEREVFKRYFEPLKVLGTLTQFSLGVTGIKPETAKTIEGYAIDQKSLFYPGEYVDTKFSDIDPTDDEARLNRLTSERNHYWQYFYTAAFIKELDAQWRNAGFPLDQNKDAGIYVTLFNIGFRHSKPNVSPKLGGAVIAVGGTPYSYGELGDLFYHSDELPQFKK